MVAILTIAVVILLVWILRLEGRVSQLEWKLGTRQISTKAPDATAAPTTTSAPASSESPAATIPPITEPTAPTPAPHAASMHAPAHEEMPTQRATLAATTPASDPNGLPVTHDHGPDWWDRFVGWLGDNTLIKIGSFFFFLGAIWFVTFAIGQGWISETLRIVLGIGLGIGVAALGRFRYRPADPDVSEYITLTVLGGAIVTGSIYAGQFLYLLFSPVVALVLLVLVVVYIVAVSLHTQTEWPAAVGALASLAAPLLINQADPSLAGFFSYLLVMAAGFSAVVYLTAWRTPMLVMALGTYWYVLLAVEEPNQALLWIFSIWFALLYFVSTSVSLWRTRQPHALDLTVLGVTTLFFAFMANHAAILPAVAMFIAALAAAAVGYGFRVAGLPERITVVYAVSALFSLFVGTSFLLDGYSLVLAFTLEVAVVLAAGLRLQFSPATLGTMTALWILPIAQTLPLLDAPAWQRGIFHVEGLAVYVLTGALVATAALALNQYQRDRALHVHTIAAWLSGMAWVALVITWGLVCYWFNPTTDDSWYVAAYLGWAAVSAFATLAVWRGVLPIAWRGVVLTTFFVPAIMTMQSLVSSSWKTGVWHADALGLCIVTGALIAAGAVAYVLMRRGERPFIQTFAAVCLVIGFIYATLFIWLVSGALVNTLLLTLTIALTLNVLLSYLFFVGLFRTHAPTNWSLAAVWSLCVPVCYSLPLVFRSWDSLGEPHAIAVYVLVTVMCLIAVTLKSQPAADETDQNDQQFAFATLVIAAAVYAVRVVWLAAHAVFASSDYAVTAALLIYTVAGLALYLVGSRYADRALKLAGTLLLALVVGRLLLIEVWTMELLWRVVTFLGVGGLFIAAALFERDQTDRSTVAPDEHQY